ncbi:Kae1-associated kinase Bud32, partial [Candidatus Bathyarchaeota archaeon]|nr:Kae1-associated kinase Bud32 [Candidatus Bathyarchaeota archaeon]
MERVIAKGAEADLVLREWNGLKALSKIRRPKGYRHPELDSRLRRSRTKAEADSIHRAKLSGVPTPLLYQVDPDNAVIVMEYIDGVKVRDAVDGLTDEERRELFTRIGGYAGRLHGAGIIHGDLTTSNILKQGDRLVFIDFGLAEVSTEVEKRGVDLNLMNRMLTSTHYRHQEELLAAFVEGYRETLGAEAEEALTRME